MTDVLRMEAVSHGYDAGSLVLEDFDLAVAAGETVALVGPSGSGKTTALTIAGLLQVPSSGRVRVAGEEPSDDASRTQSRARHVGFLFQDARLVRHLTVLENVMLPLLADTRAASTARALELLEAVGLSDLAGRRPGTLSGGQAQRVAFCRALVRAPQLVLADEPTSALDRQAAEVLRGCLTTAAADGVAVVVATHDPLMTEWSSRVVELDRGAMKVVR